ncbi:hypothetical protein BDR07DRAFT_1476227 [Suillus spraguei]|nr:hypothetical protein BDR07DRAFT_1476227 [Suillus spraguei]
MAALPPSSLTILLLLHIPLVYSSLPNLIVTTLVISDSPSGDSTRTLWEIIWSCAATLFACTWTAIHPNIIPSMDEGKFTVISRRLGIMTMALIAPELMITWATAQFLSARNAAKAFNDAFGTQLHQAHSNHPDMVESTATLLGRSPTSDGRNRPQLGALAGHNFRGWTVTHAASDSHTRRTSSVQMPIIVEADIEDRSKGDALFKGIAVLQLAWFVL